MGIMGPEEYLQRLAEVGTETLDNQQLSNSMVRGYDAVSVVGRYPGRETLIDQKLAPSLPEPEETSAKATTKPFLGADFGYTTPGLG